MYIMHTTFVVSILYIGVYEYVRISIYSRTRVRVVVCIRAYAISGLASCDITTNGEQKVGLPLAPPHSTISLTLDEQSIIQQAAEASERIHYD